MLQVTFLEFQDDPTIYFYAYKYNQPEHNARLLRHDTLMFQSYSISVTYLYAYSKLVLNFDER